MKEKLENNMHKSNPDKKATSTTIAGEIRFDPFGKLDIHFFFNRSSNKGQDKTTGGVKHERITKR